MSVIRAGRYGSFEQYFNESLEGHYGRARGETMLCTPEEGRAIWRVATAVEAAQWVAAMRRGGGELRACPMCKNEAIMVEHQVWCKKCGG